jgi:hypothetical protein
VIAAHAVAQLVERSYVQSASQLRHSPPR